MRKFGRVSIILLFIAVFMSGCSPKDDTQSDSLVSQEQYEKKQKLIDNFKNKHSAIDLDNDYDDVTFSAEIVDKCKEKNIYSPVYYISDVFYSDDELYMYAESWGDSMLLLKITQEQYATIQSLVDGSMNYNLHTVFTLDNIEPMLPTLRADFEFTIFAPDDHESNSDIFVSYDSKVIHGTLVDIIEIQ